jgi:hypothetical protein
MIDRRATGLGLALLATLGACVGCSSTTGEAPAQSVTSPESLIHAFNAFEADYDQLESPNDLAKDASLVVRGSIVGFSQGRSFPDPEGVLDAVPTAVMEVNVTEVLQGQMPEGSSRVFVEFFAMPDAEEFDRLVPDSSDAVLYLLPVEEDVSPMPGRPVADADAGRPVGAPLYTSVSPQGFYVDVGSSVVQVVDEVTYPESGLGEFEPGSGDFPPAEDPVTQ